MKPLDASSSIEEIAGTVSPSGHGEIERVLGSLGFVRKSGRHFVHAICPYTLEFPPWPLAVGRQVIREWATHPGGSLSIQILTPTQCVMDRIAAFYDCGIGRRLIRRWR